MNRLNSTFVVLLVLSLVLVSFHQNEVKAEANTVFVPDDYSTIQEAVEYAAEGDTVFVKNGVYRVDDNTTLVISKTLSLIGEDPENTVILGAFSMYPENDVAIRVAAPDVTLSGFTIKDCPVAIAIANYYAEPYPSGCRIVNNNIVNNSEGIRPQRNDVFISGNNITGNKAGITGSSTENVFITGNNITDNHYFGINIGMSRNVTICGNNITQNDVGIVLLIFPNGGDVAVSGVGNTVFGNLFIDNSEQVSQDETDFVLNSSWSMGTDIVLWDNGTLGNYWDDYTGVDENGDEIGDTPYIIDENNQDNYPSVNPPDISSIPEFPSLAILPLLATILLVIFVYRKNI